MVRAKKEFIIGAGAEDHPYSSAVTAGDYIFLSGQIGSVDNNGRKVKGIDAQVKQCLENMKQVLERAGSCLRDRSPGVIGQVASRLPAN